MSHYMTALAMKQKGLKPAAKIVLYWLADHHNEGTGLCFPSLKTLADECEMNKSTLIRHLDALEEAGLIERDKRNRENGSRASNSYMLTLTPVAECNHPCRETQQAPVAKRDRHTNLGNTNLGNEQDNGHRDAAAGSNLHQQDGVFDLFPFQGKTKKQYVGDLAEGCRSTGDEFDRVWPHYPRKVKKSVARNAWIKARKSVGFETIADPLRIFIRVQKGTDLSSVPHFATWLNQRRWEDDQTHARNRAETTSDRLDRLGEISTDTGCDQIAGPQRKLPEIELRFD
jgi:hypothetical protein